jgi:hypothetical protein
MLFLALFQVSGVTANSLCNKEPCIPLKKMKKKTETYGTPLQIFRKM